MNADEHGLTTRAKKGSGVRASFRGRCGVSTQWNISQIPAVSGAQEDPGADLACQRPFSRRSRIVRC